MKEYNTNQLNRVAAQRLNNLRDEYSCYMKVVDTPLGYDATQSDVVKWYRYLMVAYDMVNFAFTTARSYADWIGKEVPQPINAKSAKSMDAEIREIVPSGKIPHPNEYLSEEQRGVLVLLDKLEKEET